MNGYNTSPGRRRRGLTLVEVMIATVVSLILTAAAVAFATQETRLMDVSQERLEMSMVGRSAVALLADDLRKAGAGVGYNEQGQFLGLLANTFNAGGMVWNPAGNAIPENALPPFPMGAHTLNKMTRPRAGQSTGKSYQVATHDLGIRFADGSFATIVRERGFNGILCNGPDISFDNNELVVLRDATGISALSGTIQVGAAAIGPGCRCTGGCSNFSFTPTPDMNTGPGANRVTYGYGEVQGGFSTVVWFVAETPNGEGQLRRADFSGGAGCVTRDACGGLVADYAETLLTQIWRWNSVLNRWVQAGQGPTSASTERMRVDVELVLRSENETQARRPVVQTKLLANNCIPSACGTDGDRYTRVAYRTSVEIMNSGFMRMR